MLAARRATALVAAQARPYHRGDDPRPGSQRPAPPPPPAGPGRRGARRSMSPRPSATCPGWSCSRAPDPAATPAGRTSPPTRSRSSSRRPPVRTRSRSRAGWSRASTGRSSIPADAPPFLGGLVGFLGYDLGAVLERLPALAPADQDLPPLRLALHDWVVAWDRRTGSRLDRRPGARRRRATPGAPARRRPRPADRRRRARRPTRPRETTPRRRLSSSARAWTAPHTRPASTAVREHIARGDLYQANLTRRLETPFDGDPWPLYRRLRTGDPSLFSAYLDLGLGPADRAAAGPPVGLAGAVPVGRRPRASSRPTRSRARARAGATPRRGPGARPRAARERQGPRRERDDRRRPAQRPRPCLPPGECPRPAALPARADGRRPAPRLDRDRQSSRRAATPSTCSAASFPGGSITGAPKIRAMEILEELEPVRRGPYTGALGWIGPDGAMQTSILIRTFVADGRRLTLHVGGGITWRSDPAAEWDETVAKARGPLGAIGGVEVAVSRRSRRDRPRHRARLGRRPGPAGRRRRTSRCSIAASSSATGSSRRCGRAAADPTELAEHVARLRRSAAGLAIAAARRPRRRLRDRDRRRCSRPRASTGPTATPRSGSRSRAGRSAAAASCRPTRIVDADDRDPGLAGRRRRRPTTSSAACTSSRRRSGATRRTRSRRSRRRRAPTTSTRGSRPAAPAPTTRCS